MKTPSRSLSTLVVVFCIGSSSSWLAGETLAYRKNEIVETKLSQQDLQSSTSKISREIADLLAELRSNQLDGKQVASAESTLTQLTGVSETEMAAVLENLELADNAEVVGEFQTHVVGAIKEQNKAADRLQRLANALLARQSFDGLAQRIQSAIQRQTRNIQQTEGVLNGGNSKKQKESTEALLESAKLQQAGLAKDMESFASTFSQIQDGDEKSLASSAAALFKARDVTGISVSARDQLQAGDLPSSLTGQRELLSALSALFAAIQDPAARAAALKNLQQESSRLAEAERQLAAETSEGKSGKREPMKEAQRILAARTEAMAAQLAALDPAAAKIAAEASQKMAESLEELSERKTDFEAASASQSEAADLLAKAAEDLAIAAAEQPATSSPAAAFDALEKLDKELAQAEAAQAAIEAAKTSEAPSPSQEKAQQAVADAVAEAQADVAPLLPSAAQTLAEAQQQMADPATSAEAAQTLADARSEIQEELKELAPAAAEEKQLAALDAEIEEAAKLAEKANALAEAPPSGAPNADAEKAMAFADAKNAALDAQKAAEAAAAEAAAEAAAADPAGAPAEAAAGTPPSPGAEAAAALAEAAKSLSEAMKQAAAGETAAAAESGKKAEAALAEAKSAVAAPGGPPSEAQASAAPAPGAPAPGSPESAPPSDPTQSTESGGGQSTSLVASNVADGPSAAAELKDLTGRNDSAVVYATVSTSEDKGAVLAARLKPTERDALSSLQKEKAPKGYAPVVEQYYRNLAERQ